MAKQRIAFLLIFLVSTSMGTKTSPTKQPHTTITTPSSTPITTYGLYQVQRHVPTKINTLLNSIPPQYVPNPWKRQIITNRAQAQFPHFSTVPALGKLKKILIIDPHHNEHIILSPQIGTYIVEEQNQKYTITYVN